jgi:hypothetical protein
MKDNYENSKRRVKRLTIIINITIVLVAISIVAIILSLI